MESANNNESPFYKICKMRLEKSKPIQEKSLPEWVKTEIFRLWIVGAGFQFKPKTEQEHLFSEENLQLDKKQAFKLCCLTVH